MGNFAVNLGLLAGQNLFLAYFVLFLAIIITGNIGVFFGFWMAWNGYLGSFGLLAFVVTVLAADIASDILWYSVGRATRSTGFGNWIRRRFLPSWHDRLETAFQTNGKKWIVMSKFMYASTFPILFSAGWAQMDFKRYFKTSLLSIVIWVPVLFGLLFGIMAGIAPLAGLSIFKEIEILILVGFVLFMVFDYFIAKYLKRALKIFFEEENDIDPAE